MVKNITLGRYFVGNSFLHRSNPKVKILVLVSVLVKYAKTPPTTTNTINIIIKVVAIFLLFFIILTYYIF